MLDFAMLPPEITSARMYSGPGSGPMMVAAAAWDALSGQLNTFALGYSSVISELQGQNWAGPASDAMVTAATPFVAWVTATATLTEQAGSQARAAAAAYETAYAATVPPQVVEANRLQLAALAASNFLGQNTTQIAATEAAYAEMWAQDAAAMYGYAASSSTAAQLAPFHQPPQTTNALGQAGQPAAAAQAIGSTAAQNANTALAQSVPSVAPQSPDSLAATALNGVSSFNTLSGPVGFAGQISRTISNGGSFLIAAGKLLAGSAPKLPVVAPAAATTALGTANGVLARETVSAGMGKAAPLGQLSVPRSWADMTPVAAAAEDPLWLSDTELEAASSWEAAPEAAAAGGSPAGVMGPMAGMAGAAMGRASVSNILRVGPRRFSMPRPAAGG